MKQIAIIFLLIVIFIGCGEERISEERVNNRAKINSLLLLTEEELLDAVNRVRNRGHICCIDEGVVGPSPALKWNQFLTFSAKEHSRDMAFSNTFSHNGSGTSYDITGSLEGEKSLFSERIHRHLEIESIPTGENIAVGIVNIDEVLDAWLKSPKHCANIMSKEFTDMGMAVVTNEDSSYGIYWTQDFARID